MIAEDQKTTRILKVIRDATGHTRLLLHAYAGIVNQVYALIEEAKDDACRGAIALCGLQTLLGERVNRDGWTTSVDMFQRLSASDPRYRSAVADLFNKVHTLAEHAVETHAPQLPQYGLDYLVAGIPVPR